MSNEMNDTLQIPVDIELREERNKRCIHILYHADTDGRYAGYVASKRFGEHKAQSQTCAVFYYEVQYGQPFPLDVMSLSKKDEIYILDFSYSRATLLEIGERVEHIVVLDHHKSAAKELKGIGEELSCWSYIVFDMSKSGALLAHEYFYPDAPVPYGLKLINDRDLWTKKYVESTHLESYIRAQTLPKLGHEWTGWGRIFDPDKVHQDDISDILKKGADYHFQEQKLLDKFANSKRHAIVRDHNGLKVCLYNCPGHLHSELAERFYTTLDVDYTLGWRVIDNGQTVLFNLRSNNGTDVSEIAKGISARLGGLSGGGHPAAAGATMSLFHGFGYIHALSLTTH